ncbi:TOMM precursor leader peptide-binding protein [Paenibacillus filicis]|uniref:TOMM leader peptide-binding protein n=1 Tax=Paenibacillus gyeongsangnamensis TaxID=3388067 RepID=A0ABT4Q4N4_9BACL|nr:TOMM precursor leader peptide-binding protein [Paenibacillus filicis]MCZ8511838.1 TOMM precursor leader peptide-binding protein [Paenibacillus filicis]
MSYLGECVLAVGSGPILVSLVEAWYDSGFSKLAVAVTGAQDTDAEALKTLAEQALRRDPEASLDIVAAAEDGDWKAAVRPFPFILYVTQHGDLEELRELQSACLAERKPMLPAVMLRGRGMAGPLLRPDGEGCWESAWRRVHSPVFHGKREPQASSAAAAAALSNLIVNEWRRTAAGEQERDVSRECYILDPVTLEGSWHPFLPHPLVSGYEAAVPVADMELELEAGVETEDIVDTEGTKNTENTDNAEEWFTCFSRMTSTVSGIFHVWEEGELSQLPLAQCLVEPVDPLSEGPAELLPAIVCSGLTHEEARRESALAGLEAYAARLTPLLVSGLPPFDREDIGIGAGCTFAEAALRGLSACLTKELGKRTLRHEPIASPIDCIRIEDVRCRFYLQALSLMEGEPLIAAGEPLLGFPVAWVRSGSDWYGSVGLSMTFALRRSLQMALMKTERAASSPLIRSDREPQSITIPSAGTAWHPSWVRSAVQTLRPRRKRLEVYDMRFESFLRDGPFGVYGVLLREEVSP